MVSVFVVTVVQVTGSLGSWVPARVRRSQVSIWGVRGRWVGVWVAMLGVDVDVKVVHRYILDVSWST